VLPVIPLSTFLEQVEELKHKYSVLVCRNSWNGNMCISVYIAGMLDA